MHYDPPVGLVEALAHYAPTLQAEFPGLGDLTAHPLKKGNCLFCDYGAADPEDKARIIFETPDFLLVDRPYLFDESLYLARRKNAGMSFLHILVLTKKHIHCVATIPDPDLIDSLHSVFYDFLSANAAMETAEFPLHNGQKISVTQPGAILTLLKREWAKLKRITSDHNQLRILADAGLTAVELEDHFATHARALSNKTLSAGDFATYFHVPPSIWHLHMHFALADESMRTHSTGVVDKFSMDASAAKKELQRIRANGI